jgi:hypothetical protein
MIRAERFCLVSTLVLVMGVAVVTAASAESLPLPLIHTALPGETYPINLGGQLLSKQSLRNENGGVFKGTDVSMLLNVKELSALGGATIEFLGVTETVPPETKCFSEGALEANGEVILPGAEFHLVLSVAACSGPGFDV